MSPKDLLSQANQPYNDSGLSGAALGISMLGDQTEHLSH